MRSRLVNLTMVLLLSGWFTIIVPAHQRGAIRLPGSDAQPAAAPGSCCSKTTASGCHGDPADSESEDPGDPVRSCAVCHLVAKLSTPDVFIMPLPAAEPIAALPVAAPAEPGGTDFISPRRSRAPPARA